MAIGCIQAQRCHTGHCPTGVTAQQPWLIRGLDPRLKSVRCANYILTLRKELLQLSRACSAAHPALVARERLELIDPGFQSRSISDVFGYRDGVGALSEAGRERVTRMMTELSASAPAPHA